MITPGQTFENPVTGERFTFTDTASSTGGELLAFDFALRPGGAVPLPHVHPVQTERFEVVEGRMRFRVGLRTVIAGPGDVVEVAPGVAHSFANDGEDEARLHVEVRPALAMEEMFAEVVAMAQEGRMNARGLPRNLLDLALLARTYDRRHTRPCSGSGCSGSCSPRSSGRLAAGARRSASPRLPPERRTEPTGEEQPRHE